MSKFISGPMSNFLKKYFCSNILRFKRHLSRYTNDLELVSRKTRFVQRTVSQQRVQNTLLFLLKSGDSQTTVTEQTVHFLTASLCHRVGFYFMALQLCYCDVFKTQFQIQILIVTLIYWQVLPSSRLRAFRSSLLLTQSGLLSHNS